MTPILAPVATLSPELLEHCLPTYLIYEAVRELVEYHDVTPWSLAAVNYPFNKIQIPYSCSLMFLYVNGT